MLGKAFERTLLTLSSTVKLRNFDFIQKMRNGRSQRDMEYHSSILECATQLSCVGFLLLILNDGNAKAKPWDKPNV